IAANMGSTVRYTESPILNAGERNRDLAALTADLGGGGIDTLLILEGNPAYSAPADVPFAAALRGVRNSLYLGLYDNETARDTTWFVPSAHYLESWGDGRAYDGTASVVQPLIAPLYDGHTVAEVLALVAGETGVSAYELVRRSWSSRPEVLPSGFDSWWSEALVRGSINGTASP